MTKADLQLRGHHVAIFVSYYNKQRGMSEHPGPIQPDSQYSHGITDLIGRGENSQYGSKHFDGVMSVWDRLIADPNKTVEIVDGLDSICGFCPIPDKGCEESTPGDKDNRDLEYLSLKVGVVYTAQELIEKAIGFAERTGFWGPREKELGEGIHDKPPITPQP
jgi:hypothetical protein